MRFILLLVICLCSSTTVLYAQQQQPVTNLSAKQLSKYRQKFWDSLPNATSVVTDLAAIFTKEQRMALEQRINDFQQTTTAQIAIVTLDSFCVAKENFDRLANRIANKWSIGQKGKNNGMLICICPGIRRIRIENGDGIVPYLLNIETKRIIELQFTPSFKQGDYYTGTSKGLKAIIAKLQSRNIP